MSGERSPEYMVARRALLDALAALGPQREAVVLVGAQAIYVHTGDSNLAVAEYTTDADVALDPAKLTPDYELAAAMRAAGFYQERTKDGPLIGIWCSLRDIAGVSTVVKVDLLVPAAVGGAGRRAARIPGQEKGSILKVPGLEGCLVDRVPHAIGSFEPEDTRKFEIMVAGPASLLVSKVFKLQDREEEAANRRDRRKNKDALDVLRLLRAVDTLELAAGLERLRHDNLSRRVTETAIAALPVLLGRADSPASLMAAEAAAPAEPSEVIAASCAALVGELLGALGGLTLDS